MNLDKSLSPERVQAAEGIRQVALEAIRCVSNFVPSHADDKDAQFWMQSELINRLLWMVTEGKKNWKYSVRYRSRKAVEAAMRGEEISIHHEHVVPRKWLCKAIMDHPESSIEIASLAVACVVAVDEHKKLSEIEDGFGWERYMAAGIEVVDAASVDFPASLDLVPLEDLAKKQAERLRRIGLSGGE